ncbi:MAG: RsmB/NOP family class I SAM-dependent RNA methyltransferase [Alkalilacustris sp.]
MTPAARVAAAIGILDAIGPGTPAEQALVRWARGARYAGSGDRAAVRDHVFDALRRWRSLARMGGAETGRGRMLGALRAAGVDPTEVFGAQGHAPASLSADERAYLAQPPEMTEAEALDCPDWLAPALRDSLGADFAPVMRALQTRAPVFLRANLARCDRDAAAAALAAEGIDTAPVSLADTALEVTRGARRLRQSRAFAEGLVELQDAASQAVVAALTPVAGLRVLDLCAGGGGKALALAAHPGVEVWAHDALPARMADLPARAARAGVTIRQTDRPEAEAPFDLVLADVPCSGSGSWRRDPEGKWRLTPERLAALIDTQADILDRAAALTRPGGRLAHATCSLLAAENAGQVEALLSRHPGWRAIAEMRWTPLQRSDGFHLAILTQGTG